MSHRPGTIRDSIIQFLQEHGEGTIAEIGAAVEAKLGPVPSSSVRSYLGNNAPRVFSRTGRGRYRLTTTTKA